MEATRHVMLAGEGALSFAKAQGFEIVEEPRKYYTLPIGVRKNEIDKQRHGTVGAVALDSNGELAAATSTGGTFGKLEGRVGDTPVIGAGTWADSNVAVLADVKHLGGDGGIIAVDSTGTIEMIYNSEGMKRASVSGINEVRVATFE
jgi:isoaspartyl peptidase/L-asparaginase-like protein (Ntn-hydrolase superfamily)